MSTRKLVALAAIAPLVLGVTAADAAVKKPAPKKPVCKLVNDPAGDAKGLPVGGDSGPNEPTLDIVSADVATNATTLTGVFRMSALDASGDTSPGGRGFELAFKANGQTVGLISVVGPAEQTWANGLGTGHIVTNTKEIIFSVPLSKLPTKIKPGTKLTEITVNTWRRVSGTQLVLGRVDTAKAAAAYEASWPSCVKVGA
jgi:hypothetical protein